jgi:flagella basal body P-ring formation protein FlgA
MNSIRQKSDAARRPAQANVLAPLLALALATAATAADEAAVQSHESIRAAAERHALAGTDRLDGRAEVTVGSLDSRLRLAACDRPLETYDSPNGLNGGRGVVGVRCDGSQPWKLYVPVDIAIMERVVVSRRPLVRGQSVRAEDLALDEVDTSGLHKAYFTRIEDVVGLRSKRAVGSGTTLHAGLLQRARLVRRGGQVEIVAITDGLHVSMRGKALADGGHGDRIQVKNLNSGRVVTGTIAGSGVVHVLN